MIIKEYDIVQSTKDLNDKVSRGCKGTVLVVYPGILPVYEIEFINNAFETLDVLTVKGDEIVKESD